MGHGVTAVRGTFLFIGGWLALYFLLFFAPFLGTLFEVWLVATLAGTPLVLGLFAYGMVDAALLDRGSLPYWQIGVASGLSFVILGILVGFLVNGWDRATPSWIAAYAVVFLFALTTLALAPKAWRARRQVGRRLVQQAYLERQRPA